MWLVGAVCSPLQAFPLSLFAILSCMVCPLSPLVSWRQGCILWVFHGEHIEVAIKLTKLHSAGSLEVINQQLVGSSPLRTDFVYTDAFRSLN